MLKQCCHDFAVMIEFDDRQLLVGHELLKVKLFDICGSKKKKKMVTRV